MGHGAPVPPPDSYSFKFMNKFNQGRERHALGKLQDIDEEIEKDTNKWKDILFSWNRRINVKISILPKAMYIVNAIPTKFQWYFLQKQSKSS